MLILIPVSRDCYADHFDIFLKAYILILQKEKNYRRKKCIEENIDFLDIIFYFYKIFFTVLQNFIECYKISGNFNYFNYLKDS